MFARTIAWTVAILAAASCSGGGGSTGSGGDFRVVSFLEAGKEGLTRNQILSFGFSEAVAPGQDFFERLQIETISVGGSPSFVRPVGQYVVSGDRVEFVPRLPVKPDRSDAGFRASANYVVLLRGGPDALRSASGRSVVRTQEFTFATGSFFTDIVPEQPPRALSLDAVDGGAGVDLGRLGDPTQMAALDSAALLAAGRSIEPSPGAQARWRFRLRISEPVDPATVTRETVELIQIRQDALETADTAPPGHTGGAVSFRMPIDVRVEQTPADAGATVFLVVEPRVALVDDARYRLRFSGSILGIDFRRTFTGDNGLTGDAPGDVGGLGYVTEFLVFDRAPVTATRTLAYDPLEDGVSPETGATSREGLRNSALYNPAGNPGRAVGLLPAFGDGSDGDLSVTGTTVAVLDTGDTLNGSRGNPFTVFDPDPDDAMPNAGAPPGGLRSFDSPQPTEFRFRSFSVGSAATLRIVGVNPVRIRVNGLVQVLGAIDAAGAGGGAGGSLGAAGTGGPGGFPGGAAQAGLQTSFLQNGSCATFDSYLQTVPGAPFPFSEKGVGPGRGNPGGEAFAFDTVDNHNVGPGLISGTGGGGGSHATRGGAGEDRGNDEGLPGTPGPACSGWSVPNSSVIGVRGTPGPAYGDREVLEIGVGGSGGGAGGSVHVHQFSSVGPVAGGGGGGGGGVVEILAAGRLQVAGRITVAGGAGGAGAVVQGPAPFTMSWTNVAGGGGGGAGGSIVLISGDRLDLAGGLLDARGGAGGARPGAPGLTPCTACNGGGAGGRGFLLLMDPDGIVDGLIPGTPGDFDTFATGVLSIRAFSQERFEPIRAVPQLFSVGAADPSYLPMQGDAIQAVVRSGQRIRVFAASARADPVDPLRADPNTEIARFELAVVSFVAGAVQVSVTGSTAQLNPAGSPARDEFVRLVAEFEYDKDVEAAVGPFATIDQITIRFRFN